MVFQFCRVGFRLGRSVHTVPSFHYQKRDMNRICANEETGLVFTEAVSKALRTEYVSAVSCAIVSQYCRVQLSAGDFKTGVDRLPEDLTLVGSSL